MKKMLCLTIVSMFIIIGCSDDPIKEDVNEFDVLISYIEDEGLDYVNNMGSWIVGGGHSIDFNEYYIIDIRSSADFNAENGHIENAHNVEMANVLTHVEENVSPGDKILVVCYTGQSASYTSALLNIAGYNSYTLKFGMSYWTTEFDADHGYAGAVDKWTTNCDNWASVASGNWSNASSQPLPEFDSYPTIETGYSNGPDILKAQIQEALDRGFIGTSLSNTELPNYNVMNWWSTSYESSGFAGNPYTQWGHLDYSYQLIPGNLKLDGDLNHFDPVGPNAIYCFSGQTGAAGEAYLTVLGYDIYDIKFGTNGMIWGDMLDDNGNGFKRFPKQ